MLKLIDSESLVMCIHKDILTELAVCWSLFGAKDFNRLGFNSSPHGLQKRRWANKLISMSLIFIAWFLAEDIDLLSERSTVQVFYKRHPAMPEEKSCHTVEGTGWFRRWLLKEWTSVLSILFSTLIQLHPNCYLPWHSHKTIPLPSFPCFLQVTRRFSVNGPDSNCRRLQPGIYYIILLMLVI